MRGYTLVEILAVLVVLGVFVALAAPRLAGMADRSAVDRAVAEAVAFYRTARLRAVFGGIRVRIELSDTELTALDAGADTLIARAGGPGRHGVTLSASRPTIEIGPSGFGFGGANTTLAFHRGTAADTLFTSRLGRIRAAR